MNCSLLLLTVLGAVRRQHEFYVRFRVLVGDAPDNAAPVAAMDVREGVCAFPLVSELHPTGFFLAEKDRLRSVSLGPARRAVDATHGAGASHPFYQRSIQILDEKKFDKYVEAICERFLRRRSGPADVMF